MMMLDWFKKPTTRTENEPSKEKILHANKN
jgi:hypothetical protein